MPRSALRLTLVVSLLSCAGAPAVVVQTLAWARMARQFLRRDDLGTSLAKTFDGAHPCALCLRLKRAGGGPAIAASAQAGPELMLPSRPPSARDAGASRLPLFWAGRASPPAASPDFPPPKTAEV